MFDLEKNDPFDLDKAAPDLHYLRVGLSWDDTQINGKSPDCDVSVMMVGENGKLAGKAHFIFYNNLCGRGCGRSTGGVCAHDAGANGVKHWGDNRDGSGDGDDEVIDINLSSIDSQVQQIVVVVTINNVNDGFHFGTVTNPSVRVYNALTNDVICQYHMHDVANGSDALLMARMYKNGSSWVVEALGTPFSGGLKAALEMYPL